MKLATVLSGQAFIFRSLKEVLAKANELKSGDVLAGVAASSDLERIAAKEVLSQLLLSDLRNHPVVPYEEDEVTRINQDGIDETVYQRIKNWTVAELREYILSHETTEDDIHLLSRGLTSDGGGGLQADDQYGSGVWGQQGACAGSLQYHYRSSGYIGDTTSAKSFHGQCGGYHGIII